MLDWTNTAVTLQLFERLFHFGELDKLGLELHRVFAGEIGARYIAALMPTDRARLRAIECQGKSRSGDRFIGRWHLDAHQPVDGSGVFLGRAAFQQEVVAAERLALQLLEALA